MKSQRLPTRFAAKKWILVAQALICGPLGAFGVIMGPLFYTGALRAADGRPATGAGIPLMVIGGALVLVFFKAIFDIVARRGPILRICREGIEVKLSGRYAPGMALVPGMIRVVWSIISLHGFARRVLHVPWEGIEEIQVSGPPMAQTMAILGTVMPTCGTDLAPSPPSQQLISLPQASLVTSLNDVASAIQHFAADSTLRTTLESWAE